MDVIIIEDEQIAADHLLNLLNEIDSKIVVKAILNSVETALDWLNYNQAELIFMDVNLGNQTAFEIFDKIELKSPIIFTTAFDKYAVKAFKVNSIDYLIKPIQKSELNESLQKYWDIHGQGSLKLDSDYLQLLKYLKKPEPNYQKRFLVSIGERIKSIQTNDIAYFYADQRYVILVSSTKEQYVVDYTMDTLEELLYPQDFFRVNRQYIIHFQAIKSMHKHTRGRVKLVLQPSAQKEPIVSIDRSQAFKDWLNR